MKGLDFFLKDVFYFAERKKVAKILYIFFQKKLRL